jgi:hypothetical protein
MSDFENNDFDFDSVVAGLTLEPAIVEAADLPRVELSGTSFGLNAFEGEEIRGAMLDAFAKAVHLLKALRGRSDVLVQNEAMAVAQAMHISLEDSVLAFHKDQPLVIKGRGLFSIGSDEDPQRRLLPLASSQLLIGKLEGTAYGPFGWTTDEEIDRYESEEDYMTPKWQKDFGGLIMLHEAKVYEVDGGWSNVDFGDQYVAVPIHVKDFDFLRAYELE